MNIYLIFNILYRTNKIEQVKLKKTVRIRIPNQRCSKHSFFHKRHFNSGLVKVRWLRYLGLRCTSVTHFQHENLKWVKLKINFITKYNTNRTINIVSRFQDLIYRAGSERQIQAVRTEYYHFFSSQILSYELVL